MGAVASRMITYSTDQEAPPAVHERDLKVWGKRPQGPRLEPPTVLHFLGGPGEDANDYMEYPYCPAHRSFACLVAATARRCRCWLAAK